MSAFRAGWQLADATFWADRRTLVGGDPFRSLRLTERGADFVRRVLDGGRAARSGTESALLDRLARANLLTPPTAAPVTAWDVTLVIPARATADTVQRVLDASTDVPAIVIDDQSPLPLDGRLQHDAGLQVVRHDTSVGPAAARNRGAALAHTRWVAFCDSDVLAPAGWIGALIPYLEGNAAVAPRIVGAPGVGVAARFERASCALDMGTRPGFVSPSGVLSYLPSAALIVDRSRFLSLGGFDESMRVGEDVDLIWRAAAHGVYFEPSVVLEHRARPRLAGALARRAAYGQSAAALAVRHPDLMHHGSFPLAAALPWLLAMAGRPRLAAGASALHVALAPRSMRSLPAAAARRAALTGQSRSAIALSRMLVRPLLPATLAASMVSRRFGRRALLAAAAATALRTRSARTAGWQLVDDAAYTVGVWRAAFDHRSARLLLPRLRVGRDRPKGGPR